MQLQRIGLWNFMRGGDSTEDDLRSGRIKTSTTDEQLDMILDDKRLTAQQIGKPTSIISGSIHIV